MPFELPLFPLNVALFPGMPLSLHIFEPRYRLMMRRCLEDNYFPNNRLFGVTILAGGQEGQSDTIPHEVGCAAQITHVAPLPDGRFNLQTIGKRRFQVLSRRVEDEYWVGSVEWLDDDQADSDVLQEVLQTEALRVRSALEDYLRAIAEGAGVSTPDLAQLEIPPVPLDFSMWVAALLPFPPHEKQSLLEMTSTEGRLQEEYLLLRRAEVVQRAFTKREAESPRDSSNSGADQFVSLN